jgi:hypothetical protein
VSRALRSRVDVVGEVVVVRLQIDEVVSAEWSDCINWLSSGTDLIVREIDDRVLDAGSSDGLDQEPAVTDIVLVVNGESERILREHCVLRPAEDGLLVNYSILRPVRSARSPHRGRPRQACFMESGVPNRQHLISKPNGIPHDTLVRFVKEVRLSTLRVNVSMGTEEGHESSGLVPSNKHLDAWVTEETTDIGCTDKVASEYARSGDSRCQLTSSERHAADVKGQEHCGLSGHML